MLRTADLDFSYPADLVAVRALPRGQSRIFHISRDYPKFEELNWLRFLSFFHKNDVLVLNDTEVLRARLPVGKGEVFFLKALPGPKKWQILSRGLKLKVGKEIALPGGLKARVLKTGRLAEIEIARQVDLKKYFLEWGKVPLPPYIMNLRDDKWSDLEDRERYQTLWAREWGSAAAPTASLHFNEAHLETLRRNGVRIAFVTLHIGAGTFLPIETENVDDFEIHGELVSVGQETVEAVLKTQAAGQRVWACGTTVLRALESAVWATGTGDSRLPLIGCFEGETKLFIKPGYRFQVVDGLLTNFHQPRSSLLSLVAAFATRQQATTVSQQKACVAKILDAYKVAISEKFRLFSYGDLTIIS